MKAYTDIPQSKKLAEILPRETSDMFYWCGEDIRFGGYKAQDKDYDIPCWSLAALLGILAEQDFIIKSLERNNECQYNIDIPSRHCKIWFSSLLDAAFEMVCWLKKE